MVSVRLVACLLFVDSYKKFDFQNHNVCVTGICTFFSGSPFDLMTTPPPKLPLVWSILIQVKSRLEWGYSIYGEVELIISLNGVGAINNNTLLEFSENKIIDPVVEPGFLRRGRGRQPLSFGRKPLAGNIPLADTPACRWHPPPPGRWHPPGLPVHPFGTKYTLPLD